MNCPGCGSAIVTLKRSCGCGYRWGGELYDKLSFYFGLKDELAKLTELQNSLYAGIANVSQKIRKYEEVLRRDLAALPPVPAAGMKKKARKAAKKRR